MSQALAGPKCVYCGKPRDKYMHCVDPACKGFEGTAIASGGSMDRHLKAVEDPNQPGCVLRETEAYPLSPRGLDLESVGDRIVQARGGGATERSHGIRHHGSYSVAAHSWGVAMLMMQIWPEDFPRLAARCLVHDVPEYLVGDLPAPTKRFAPQGFKEWLDEIEDDILETLRLPTMDVLSTNDAAKVKACDCLEFWLWCREQVTMGNYFAQQGQQEVEKYLDQLPEPVPTLWRVMRRQSMVPRQAGRMKEICDGV